MPRKPETIQFMERIVMHDRLDRIDRAIRAAHDTSGHEPKSIIIAGPSGVGKSTLVKRYKRSIEIASTQECDHRPVLTVEVPPQPDLRSFQMEVLQALGHPRPERRGTLGEMRMEIIRYMERQAVEVLIIDEFQDLLPRRTRASPHIVKLIKNLMNVCKVPFVLVGMPETVDLLATGDGQLRRRFSASRTLAPFRIDTRAEFEAFTTYLAQLQTVLPVPCMNLAEPNNTLRLFCATQGLPGLISNILAKLIDTHEDDRQAVLRDLARAYSEALDDDVRTQDVSLGFNPFLAPLERVKKHVGAA